VSDDERPEGSIRLAVALRVLLPFAFGYYLSYLARNINAVIAPDLVAELGLTAASLGLLTSVYFFTFSAFQLPLGVLLDRYGPRRVESSLLLIAACGAVVFALSDSILGLASGRALIGLGVSACLMASFKANTMWFAAEKLPLVNGCIMTAGGLGALSATAPVEALLELTGWRGVFLGFAALAALAAVLLFFVVPRRDEESTANNAQSLSDAVAGVRTVFSSRAFWRVVPISTANQSAFLAMQGLWAGPWFSDVGGLDRDSTAVRLLWIAMAMVVGFFTTGAIAERLARLGVSTMQVVMSFTLLFILVQIGLIFGPAEWATVLWCLFGYFGTSGVLFYAHLAQVFPTGLAGRVITGVNVFAFGGAFLAQWGMGEVIERFPGAASGSYLELGYQLAFGVILALQCLGFLWVFLLNDRVPVAASSSGGARAATVGAELSVVFGTALLAAAAFLFLF
jgi:sugar phosphate permease